MGLSWLVWFHSVHNTQNSDCFSQFCTAFAALDLKVGRVEFNFRNEIHSNNYCSSAASI